MIIIDSHLDLGMNALMWNCDLTRPIPEIRASEVGMTGRGRMRGTVSLPQLREGRVAVCVATLLARTGSAPTANLTTFRDARQAYGMAQGQLAYYRILELQGEVRILTDRAALDAHVDAWSSWDRDPAVGSPPPLGIILGTEGGDAIVWPDLIDRWWDDGLRIVGLTHYGPSAYAQGTGSEGGLTPLAPMLFERMARHELVLDLSHLADESFWEALERWSGPVMASHNNCRALVPHQRGFSDEQIRAIAERDGVIGCALDAWMLIPGWVRGETSTSLVSLANVVDHIDHVCQVTGNARHVAIGSDLDGGFGTDQTPNDVDTVADLQKLVDVLAERRYATPDIASIMHGNWWSFFRRCLP